MRRISQLFGLFILVQAGPALANMRAPLMDEGGLVEARFAAGQGVVLQREVLKIRFPQLRQDQPYGQVEVVAEYTLENSGPPHPLELIFFATDLDQPVVTVNRGAPHKVPVQKMTEQQAQEFWQKQAARQGKDAQKLQARYTSRPYREGQTSRFTIQLQQGKNVVQYRYKQAMMIFEDAPRYGQPRYRECTTGLDYLLYPAKSWQRSKQFTLELKVVAPDLLDKGWFWDSYYAPTLKANLKLKPTYEAKSHTTTFSGRFHSLGPNVLSLQFRWEKERH